MGANVRSFWRLLPWIVQRIVPRCKAKDVGLIECQPPLDPITVFPEHKPGKVREMFHNAIIQPTPLDLKALRQVPMIEGNDGSSSRAQQGINQPIVIVDSCLGDSFLDSSTWNYPGP